jgi:hypothetical protein
LIQKTRSSALDRDGRGCRGSHDHEFAPVGRAGRDAIAAVGGRCADPKNTISGNATERCRRRRVVLDRSGELEIRILGLAPCLRQEDYFVVSVNKLDRIRVKPESISRKWPKTPDL